MKFIPDIGKIDVSDYFPSEEEEKLILEFEEQAEKDIDEKKQTANINFRWSEF